MNLGAAPKTLLLIVPRVRSGFTKGRCPRNLDQFFVTIGCDLGIMMKKKQLVDKSDLRGTRKFPILTKVLL